MELELYFYNFLALATAHFIALLSPGADFFIIISNSSKYGKKAGVFTATGIALANLAYILMALFGILLIQNNIYIFTTIKIAGSLYLIYIAYHLLKANKRELFEKGFKQKDRNHLKKSFFSGFLSAILNPKNSIFYFTMFSISIQNDTPIFVQSFYALWMFLAVLFWDIFIVYLVSSKKNREFIQNYSNHIEKGSGIILLFIASLILLNL